MHEWKEGEYERSDEENFVEPAKEKQDTFSWDSSDSDEFINTTKSKAEEEEKKELQEAVRSIALNRSLTDDSTNYSQTMTNFGWASS